MAARGEDNDEAVPVAVAAQAVAAAEPDPENQPEEDGQKSSSSPPNVLAWNSPGSNELTEHERNLAIGIREVIAATPELDPISDYMCAQLALMDGDDTERALERVHHFQCFREEYGILDSVADAKKCFKDYLELFPAFHLCFTYFPDSCNYVMFYDDTKFNCKQLNTEERIRTWMAGTYYTCTAFCPDLDAIRNGAVLVVECGGYDWKNHVDFKCLKRMWSEVATQYPVRFDKLKYFNAGTTRNMVSSMLKPFLPEYLKTKVEFGCQFDQRLDELYLVPTVEAANQRLLDRIEATLRIRYAHEQAFRL